jgi:hypothetical protein
MRVRTSGTICSSRQVHWSKPWAERENLGDVVNLADRHAPQRLTVTHVS